MTRPPSIQTDADRIPEKFAPVTTLADLDSLDFDEILEGHRSAERGDPEPGPNRGRAFWHGWRTRMMDLGEIPIDDGHMALTRAFVGREGAKRRAKNVSP